MANKITESNNLLSFAIDCGATFVFNGTLKSNGTPVDVTGYTAVLSCRSGPGGTEYFRITNADDITVGTTDGKFTFKLSSENTALLQSYGVGLKGTIQALVTDTNGNDIRLIDGKFVASPDGVN